MSDSLTSRQDEIEAIAESKGLVCIFPEGQELQLDLDLPGDRANWDTKVAGIFNAANGIEMKSILTTVSEHGNKHVYILLDTYVSDYGRIALQAALGSDPVKEALSIMRIKKDFESYSSCLFETPEEAAKVEEWRAKNRKRNEILTEEEIPF